MWKIKGTEVVWEEPRSTADRPHDLTLLIGLLSPLLAVVALMISLMSLKTSEQSLHVSETNMKIGQRGYARITGGIIRVSHGLALLAEIGAPPPPSPDELIDFNFTAAIENLGNTPVRFTKLVVELPQEAGIHFDQHDLQRSVPPELGQKARYEWSWRLQGTGDARVIQEVFQDFDEGIKLSRKQRVWRRVTIGSSMNFSLTYQDVFSEDHTLSWCWTPTIDATTGTIYGSQCR